MSSRIQYEAWLMVLSLVTGGWLMLAYDTLRVFRLVIRHGPFWTGVEDFLYWLYAGLVTFILLYEQNDGVFRAYVIGGVFAGMILVIAVLGMVLVGLKKREAYYHQLVWIR